MDQVSTVSVTEALSQAFERMKAMLLSPFNFTKWIYLGFIAFLAHLGDSSGAANFNIPDLGGSGPGGTGGTSPASVMRDIERFIADNFVIVIVVGVTATLVLVAIAVVVTWVSSRAKLMFVEAVALDKFEVSEPWKRYGPLGMSLFKLRIALQLISLVIVLGVGGAAAWLMWGDLMAGNFGPAMIPLLLVLTLGMLLLLLPVLVLTALIEDFVVPVMYARNCRVGQAWSICRQEVWRGHAGDVVVFYLLKFALGIGAGILMFIVTLMTCCLAGLPFVSSVVFLPLSVFFRGYSMQFVEQLGVRIFPEPAPAWQSGGPPAYFPSG